MESKQAPLRRSSSKSKEETGPCDSTSPTACSALGKDAKDVMVAEEKESRLRSYSMSSKSSSFDNREVKARLTEIEDEAEVEAEFEALRRKQNCGDIYISNDPNGRRIASGLRIVAMNMRDGQTGELLWESSAMIGPVYNENELTENISKDVLDCRAISRELAFNSREEINHFRIEQRVFFKGACIEEWFFSFGYVIPGSTNSWQHIIEAAPPSEMIPADVLSGNITFETSFYDEKLLLCKNVVRIYYV